MDINCSLRSDKKNNISLSFLIEVMWISDAQQKAQQEIVLFVASLLIFYEKMLSWSILWYYLPIICYYEQDITQNLILVFIIKVQAIGSKDPAGIIWLKKMQRARDTQIHIYIQMVYEQKGYFCRISKIN